jgi:hypothetical protein
LLFEVARAMRNFIWSGSFDHKKICTVSLAALCKPKDEGGLAVKDPTKINLASLLYLTWQMLTSDEQLAQICRARFLNKGKPKTHYISSSVWPGLKTDVNLISGPWAMENPLTSRLIIGLKDPLLTAGVSLTPCSTLSI